MVSAEPYSAGVSGERTDVAVVGGGICGLSAAYALRRRGVDFRLLEGAAPGRVSRLGAPACSGMGMTISGSCRSPFVLVVSGSGSRRSSGLGCSGGKGVLIRGPNVAERPGLRGGRSSGAAPRSRWPGRSASGAVTARGRGAARRTGGSIDVRAAVDGLAGALAERVVRAQVFELSEQSNGVVLRTSEGVWSAERVIVCAGASSRAQRPARARHPAPDRAAHARFVPRARARRPAGVPPGPVERAWRGRLRGTDAGRARVRDRARHASTSRRWTRRSRGCARTPSAACPVSILEPVSVRLCKTSILPWGADAFAVWRHRRGRRSSPAPTSSSSRRCVGELLAERLRRAVARASAGRPRRPRRAPAADPTRTSARGAAPRGRRRPPRASCAPAAKSAATPAPKTASSISSRTGSTVGREAFGDMNVPHTTATSSGAPSPITR